MTPAFRAGTIEIGVTAAAQSPHEQMTDTTNPGAGIAGRFAAWRAGRIAIEGFTWQPQPKAAGLPARGRQIVAGNLVLAGNLVETAGRSPWDIPATSAGFTAALHGFGWLDDLAALATPEARACAQDWTTDWIAAHGARRGPGWAPELVGRRQIRWITHAIWLLNGMPPDASRAVFDTLGRQARFLARRWPAAPPGLPRLEALVGYVQSTTALLGLETARQPARAALADHLRREIDSAGGITTRNPEELLEIFALLTWTAAILSEAGQPQDAALDAAIARVAPVLRSLRLSDGGLARFQGGGRGRPGLIDRALRQAGLRASMARGDVMGYTRISAGPVVLIADAAAPPLGPAAMRSQASTLAFQMSSGAHPIVVSCGAGHTFGSDWAQAARATSSHSTLALAGYSSARFGRRNDPVLRDGPRQVSARRIEVSGVTSLVMSHDGWSGTHGLSHLRTLSLDAGGRLLRGEDGVAAMDAADRKRLDTVLAHRADRALGFAVHFHLHPDIDATLDLGGDAVSLVLPNGEVWVFRRLAGGALSLEPSVYLDSRRLSPRASKQIVLSGRASGYGTQTRWSLARPVDAPRHRRGARAPRLR